MILGMIIGGLLMLFSVLYFVDVRRLERKTIASANRHQEIADKERDDAKLQDDIKELEADLFGIGIDIKGLPGYFWVVNRGFDWEDRNLDWKRDEDGLEIMLTDADSNILQETQIFSTKDSSQNPRFRLPVRLTIEEMEQNLQDAMKKLSDNEIKRQKYEAGMTAMVEKYNGKSVEASKVQDSPTWNGEVKARWL